MKMQRDLALAHVATYPECATPLPAAPAPPPQLHFREPGGRWAKLPVGCDADVYRGNGYEVADLSAVAHLLPAEQAGELPPLPDGILTPIPLVEPVYIAKALLAHREAHVVLSGGVGPVAAVHLVNIGLTGWVYTEETATAYAKGYNTALDQYRAALAARQAPDTPPKQG